MSEPDFSGIDPLRVPEARRRIAVLDEYLSLAAPSEADIRRLADLIGTSRSSFFRLVRVWRDHRDARLLVIGKRGASKRDYGLDRRSVEIMTAVIAEQGCDATITSIFAEIERRCTDQNLKPPSPQTVNNHTRKARAAAGNVSGPPRIVVGRMWFHLPMTDRPANAMPTLLVAIALPERAILAHRVSTIAELPPSVTSLIDELSARRTLGAARRPVLLDPDDRRVSAAALERAGLGATRSHNRSVQRELAKALNRRLGPLTAIYQRGMAKPGIRPVLSRQDQPLPAAEVTAIIEGAISKHNGAVAAAPSFDLDLLQL
jgi:hypothetical protein